MKKSKSLFICLVMLLFGLMTAGNGLAAWTNLGGDWDTTHYNFTYDDGSIPTPDLEFDLAVDIFQRDSDNLFMYAYELKTDAASNESLINVSIPGIEWETFGNNFEFQYSGLTFDNPINAGSGNSVDSIAKNGNLLQVEITGGLAPGDDTASFYATSFTGPGTTTITGTGSGGSSAGGGAPAPVPEPTTMFLFGSGLLGLIGLKRRRFMKT